MMDVTRRRGLLIGASLICAPALVRLESLMPVRLFTIPKLHCGYLEHLYFNGNHRLISGYLNAGLSAHETAAAMTARGFNTINSERWTAAKVLNLVEVYAPRAAELAKLGKYGVA